MAALDIAFDGAGNLFVLQHATGPTMLTGPGVLIRVSPDEHAPWSSVA
jgi:hypothetical protein